jgi:isopenicillin-N epimerase
MHNAYKPLFSIDPKVTFLNHGSFGACPKEVFNTLIDFQKKMEFEPVKHLAHDIYQYLKESRNALSDYVNCDKDDIAYFPNPSTALNTVIRSLDLKEGDQILTTNHEYGALDRTWNFISKKKGCEYIKLDVAVPLADKELVIESFRRSINKKTKVIFLSHITSATALIMPVKEIIALAKEHGILSIIDGAHVPGHIELDIRELKPDFYCGACHKWMCSPKGVAFLYVKKEYQNMLEPLVVSWGYKAENPSHSQFLDYMQWQGTNDISAYLTIPETIKFLKKHNWREKALHCRKLNLWAKNKICKALDTYATGADEFLGQMTTIAYKLDDPIQNQIDFYTKYKIQLPFIKWNDKTFFRISLQVYNSKQEVEYLIKSLLEFRKEK